MMAPEVTPDRITSLPRESVVVTAIGVSPCPKIGPAVGTGEVVITTEPLELVVLNTRAGTSVPVVIVLPCALVVVIETKTLAVTASEENP